MLFHELERVGLVLEIAHVAQGIDLVVGDGLDADELLQVGLVGLARGHDGEARAGQRHLRRGGEFVDHIGIARLAAECQDVPEGDEVAVKLVDAVGIVPHEGKIGRGGLQSRNARDGLVGIDDAVGVRILRHAPHALDSRILDSFFDQIHIRAGRGHGDGDELKAEGLGDLEMAVIAGGGAEPLDGIEPAPRLFRACKAVRIALADQIVHERQRGVAADEALLRPAAEHVRPEFLRFLEARQLAVVAGVDAVRDAVFRGLQNAQNIGDEIQLFLAGLAAGHIQLQMLGLQRVELRFDCCVFLVRLGGGQILVCNTHSGKDPFFLHTLQRGCLLISVYRVRAGKARRKPEDEGHSGWKSVKSLRSARSSPSRCILESSADIALRLTDRKSASCWRSKGMRKLALPVRRACAER